MILFVCSRWSFHLRFLWKKIQILAAKKLDTDNQESSRKMIICFFSHQKENLVGWRRKKKDEREKLNKKFRNVAFIKNLKGGFLYQKERVSDIRVHVTWESFPALQAGHSGHICPQTVSNYATVIVRDICSSVLVYKEKGKMAQPECGGSMPRVLFWNF